MAQGLHLMSSGLPCMCTSTVMCCLLYMHVWYYNYYSACSCCLQCSSLSVLVRFHFRLAVDHEFPVPICFTAHAHMEQAEIRPFCARKMASQAPSGNDDNGDKKPPREMKKRTGYECEFVEPPPKQFQSECPICLQILREPYILDCCGYSFCAACIERVGKDGKPCPHCNQPGYTTLVNKGLKRALNEFRVYCPHRLSGCEWEGELGKLDEHLNSDPLPERQLEGCPFAVIECLHCKEGIRRDNIAGHQLERCPQRPYTCEYCAEYKSTFEDVAHSHWSECKCFLLPCPKECKPSGSGIQRQCLDQHVKEECPLTVVQCELHHAGCEMILPRKDMAEHMKEDSIAHISLLVHELNQTKQELTHTKQELTQTKQELTQKVATQERFEQELTRKVTTQGQELEAKLRETQLQAIDQIQIQQQCELLELRAEIEMQRDIPPVTIKMAGFDELKKKGTTWYSRPFYTGMGGYKMCLNVYANGYGAGKGTHVSVCTCLMRGELDSHLKWPFQGTITIQLVNQLENNNHRTYPIPYTDESSDATSGQVIDGERSHGRDCLVFLPHSKLGLSVANNRQYLKDDCLIFRIVPVKLN